MATIPFVNQTTGKEQSPIVTDDGKLMVASQSAMTQDTTADQMFMITAQFGGLSGGDNINEAACQYRTYIVVVDNYRNL